MIDPIDGLLVGCTTGKQAQVLAMSQVNSKLYRLIDSHLRLLECMRNDLTYIETTNRLAELTRANVAPFTIYIIAMLFSCVSV